MTQKATPSAMTRNLPAAEDVALFDHKDICLLRG